MPDHAGRLEDHQAIVDLLYQYCLRVDSFNPTAVAELFVDEPVISYGPFTPAPLRSRTELVEQLRDRLGSYSVTRHQLTNPMITFEDPDHASGITYMYAWHECVDGSADRECWGQYEDRFERVDGAWKIAERDLVIKARRGYPGDEPARAPRSEAGG